MSHHNRYAVFGHPIGHSKSPSIHTAFAQQTGQKLSYEAFDVPPEKFDEQLNRFLRQGGHGLNCTVPLKELAFQRADELSAAAQLSGAVNTLSQAGDGRLIGDNTDGIGLIQDLTGNLRLQLANRNILLLGAGGASRGVIAPLLAQSPKYMVIANRTAAKAEALAKHFADQASNSSSLSGQGLESLEGQTFDLILNATAASLSGELPALPETLLAKNGACYDLAYGAKPTPFVRWGQTHGAAITKDGLGMLVEQAAAAFEIWRGVRPDTQDLIRTLEQERSAIPT